MVCIDLKSLILRSGGILPVLLDLGRVGCAITYTSSQHIHTSGGSRVQSPEAHLTISEASHTATRQAQHTATNCKETKKHWVGGPSSCCSLSLP